MRVPYANKPNECLMRQKKCSNYSMHSGVAAINFCTEWLCKRKKSWLALCPRDQDGGNARKRLTLTPRFVSSSSHDAIGRRRIRHRVAGHGPALVLLHGFGGRYRHPYFLSLF